MEPNHQKIFVNTLTSTTDKEIQTLPNYPTVVSSKLLSAYITDNLRKGLQGLEITTDGHIILEFQESKLLAVCHHGDALVPFLSCNMRIWGCRDYGKHKRYSISYCDYVIRKENIGKSNQHAVWVSESNIQTLERLRHTYHCRVRDFSQRRAITDETDSIWSTPEQTNSNNEQGKSTSRIKDRWDTQRSSDHSRTGWENEA